MLEVQELKLSEPKPFIHHVILRKNGGKKRTVLLLTAALPPTEWPKLLIWVPFPGFFFNTTTCPSCLDPVAVGNQIAESELRKPHPLSGNWLGWLGQRLMNSHSDLSISAACHSTRESQPWNTHNACCFPLPPPRLLISES